MPGSKVQTLCRSVCVQRVLVPAPKPEGPRRRSPVCADVCGRGGSLWEGGQNYFTRTQVPLDTSEQRAAEWSR
jgi:hypothetical protein